MKFIATSCNLFVVDVFFTSDVPFVPAYGNSQHTLSAMASKTVNVFVSHTIYSINMSILNDMDEGKDNYEYITKPRNHEHKYF